MPTSLSKEPYKMSRMVKNAGRRNSQKIRRLVVSCNIHLSSSSESVGCQTYKLTFTSWNTIWILEDL